MRGVSLGECIGGDLDAVLNVSISTHGMRTWQVIVIHFYAS